MTQATNQAPGYGPQARPAAGSEFGALRFAVQQLLARVRTATLVQVKAVHTAGGVAPVGTVDVQPLVNQVAGVNGVAMPQVHGLPYLRLQGGAAAVIVDPRPGDIGVAVFCDRDISAVKASRQKANPGSARAFDLADGIFLGVCLSSEAPTTYIQVTDGTVSITSTTAVNVQAPAINLGASGDTLHKLVTEAFMAIFNAHTHPVSGSTAAPTATPMLTTHLTNTLKGG